MTDALTAITKLIDYAESSTREPIEDVRAAREALRRLAALVVAGIVVEQRRQRAALFSSVDAARDGWLPAAHRDLDRAINDLNSIEGEQTVYRSEFDAITLHDSPGRHA